MRGRLTLSMASWVAVETVAIVVCVLGTVTAVLSAGGLQFTELVAVALGAVVGGLIAAVVVLWSRQVTTGLRELRADAVRRLQDPSARPRLGRQHQVMRSSVELTELARVMDALQLRARVSDEVAAQARQTAEQTSAGVFGLLSGLVAAEEATRGQLSAELHDTVAQSLAAARSLLADRGLAADPDLRAQVLERVSELVEDAEEQVRAVMARARPAELRDGDLATAVGALRRELAVRYLFTVRLSWPEQPYPLPLVTAVTVYRFYQEALLNVVKHANVDEAEVRLAVDGEDLVAVVRDEGPGFDPTAVESTGGRHVGLGLLRERARLAGGSLAIHAEPDSGSTLTLRLPLAPRATSIPIPR